VKMKAYQLAHGVWRSSSCNNGSWLAALARNENINTIYNVMIINIIIMKSVINLSNINLKCVSYTMTQ